MMENSAKKYLVNSDNDTLWGITVNTVGCTDIPAGYHTYPSEGHPENFNFAVERGRILDSYQLVYISRGKGRYFTAPGRGVEIKQGDLFILRPKVWHSYLPDKKTGWQEYWIGVKGHNLDQRFENGFFDPKQVVYKVGFREEIVDLYQRAIGIAEREKPASQQFLAGIANLILGMAMYYDRNDRFTDNSLVEQINRARTIIRENLLSDISPEQIAEQVNMSYSWFRKTFKEYTNLSPAHYIQELKLQKAKDMLANTRLSIKEVAYTLNYDNVSYFSTIFKKYIGSTPMEYRAVYGTGERVKED